MGTFYTVKQVAKILGFSTNTIYKFLAEGKIKGVRMEESGRFRIPKEELDQFTGKLRGMEQKQDGVFLQKNASTESQATAWSAFVRHARPESLNLFDWLMGVLAILLGIAFLLGPTYLQRDQFRTIFNFLPALGVGMTLAGIGLVVSDLFAARTILWNQLSGFVVLILSLMISIGFAQGGDYAGMTLYGILTVGLGVKVVRPTISPWRIFLLFFFLFSTTTSLFWLVFPEHSLVGFLPPFLEPFRVVFGVLWLVVAGIYGFALVSDARYWQRYLGISLALAVSLLFLAVWAVVEGAWDRMVYLTILGVFSILFPFWHRFEKRVEKNNRRIFAGICWLVFVIAIGLVFVDRGQMVVKRFAINETDKKRITAVTLLEQGVTVSRKSLEQLASNPAVVQAMAFQRWDDPLLAPALKQQYELTNLLRYVGLVDPQGVVQAVYPIAPGVQGSQVGDLAAFKSALQDEGRTVIGDRQPSITVAVKADQKIVGVVSGWIDLEAVQSALANVAQGQRNAFVLANQRGEVVSGSEPYGTLSFTSTLVNRANLGEHGTFEGQASAGDPVLASYGPIPTLGWSIIAFTLTDTLLAETNSLSMMVFLGFVAIAVVTLVLVSFRKEERRL